MLWKKLSLWVALLLIVIPLAYASGLLRPVKPNDLNQLSKGRYNLLSMIVGCEMDNKCMQVTLTNVIRTDPHPVYEAYLAELKNKKADIEYEQMHCNNKEIRAYRRGVTTCLADMLNRLDPKYGLDFKQTRLEENKLNSCLVTKTNTMAKLGNIYAQSALMREALKRKDIPTFNRWYSAVQKQRMTLEFATFRECQNPVQMFDLINVNTREHE